MSFIAERFELKKRAAAAAGGGPTEPSEESQTSTTNQIPEDVEPSNDDRDGESE